MKTNYFFYKLLVVAVCVIATSSSCGRVTEFVQGGDEVRFAGVAGESSSETRAVYESGEFSDKAPVYWEDGDVVTICCDESDDSQPENVKQADYIVSEVNENDKSKAVIVLDSEKNPIGLRWNQDPETSHYFYAYYPAEQLDGVCKSIDLKSVECEMPYEQNTLDNSWTQTEDGNCFINPDLKWMLMCSATDGYTRESFPVDGAVALDFKPLCTAIQFTVENQAAEEIELYSLTLKSKSNQICGNFKIEDLTQKAGDGYPVVNGDADSEGSEVSINLGYDSISIQRGKTFTFTFFLAPVSDLDDLSLIVEFYGDAYLNLSTFLGYTDETGLEFPRCRKSYVKGIVLPDRAQYTIDYSHTVGNWLSGGKTEKLVLTE